MKKNKIIGMAIVAVLFSGLTLLSSCSRSTLSTPFKVYYYTTNQALPTLYIVHNNKVLGRLPVLTKDPVTLDSAELSVMCYDANTEIIGADSKGHIISTFDYNFNDDGTFKEGGGGYLLFDTWQKEKYNLLIRINQQF